MGALKSAQQTFFDIGVSVEEALQILDHQLSNLQEMAKFIIAHVTMAVLSDERVLTNHSFIESIDLVNYTFHPDQLRERYARHAASKQVYQWSFDSGGLSQFSTEARAKAAERVASQTVAGGEQWTTLPL